MSIKLKIVSPQSLAREYENSYADPASGWGTPDFYIPEVVNGFKGDLVLVNDGTDGTNAQGQPISLEGCNPLINGTTVNGVNIPSLEGKIAVIFRNTCEFGIKALNAQNAGAIGVIIVNRNPDEVIAMGTGANGANVTIPVFMISLNDGLPIIEALNNGEIVTVDNKEYSWSLTGNALFGWGSDTVLEKFLFDENSESSLKNKIFTVYVPGNANTNGEFKIRETGNWGTNIGGVTKANSNNGWTELTCVMGGNNYSLTANTDGYTFIYYSGDNDIYNNGDKFFYKTGEITITEELLNTLIFEKKIWVEDFANGIPSTWQNLCYKNGSLVLNPNDNELWQYNVPPSIPSFVTNIQNLSVNFNPIESETVGNGYIYFDSDALGSNYSSAVELITDTIDLTGENQVFLVFNIHTRQYQAKFYVDYSIDNGATFTRIINNEFLNDLNSDNMKNKNTPPDQKFIQELSSELANQSQVKIKIRFEHAWDWGLMVDDIQLLRENPVIIPVNPDLTLVGNFGTFTPASLSYDNSLECYTGVYNFTSLTNNPSFTISNFGGVSDGCKLISGKLWKKFTYVNNGTPYSLEKKQYTFVVKDNIFYYAEGEVLVNTNLLNELSNIVTQQNKWSLVGFFNNWGGCDVVMNQSASNNRVWYLTYDFSPFSGTTLLNFPNEIKFRYNSSWEVNAGGLEQKGFFYNNDFVRYYKTTQGGRNIPLEKNKTYTFIYFTGNTVNYVSENEFLNPNAVSTDGDKIFILEGSVDVENNVDLIDSLLLSTSVLKVNNVSNNFEKIAEFGDKVIFKLEPDTKEFLTNAYDFVVKTSNDTQWKWLTKIINNKQTLNTVSVLSPNYIIGEYENTFVNEEGWGTILPQDIEGDLVMVEDGTPGTNPQGNPISQEGCNPLINGSQVNGKIAVIYRNTCEFGLKALNAQNAGAIGVIIINRDNEVFNMGPGAEGANVTIPVVMLSYNDGKKLVNAMVNNTVRVKINYGEKEVLERNTFTFVTNKADSYEFMMGKTGTSHDSTTVKVNLKHKFNFFGPAKTLF